MVAADASWLDDDLRAALFTSAASWRDHESKYTSPELAAAVVLLACVAGAVTVMLVSAGLPGGDAAVLGPARWGVAAIGAVTLVIAVSPSLLWPLGWRPRRSGPAVGFAAVRVGALTLVVGCWTGLLGPVAPAPIGVLGLVVGCEYTLTAWVLEARTNARAWWLTLQRSSVHVGIWVVCVAGAIVDPGKIGDLLRIPLSFQLIAAAGAATCYLLERLRRAMDYRRAAATRETATEVRQRLAHWLHDDLTTSIGFLQRGLQSGGAGVEDAAAELGRLDHRLRLRQLDEMLATGTVQLAQVLQPYVRLAQAQGVEVVDVPRFDAGSATLHDPTGRLVQRALGVLVPNAITAGATQLALRVRNDGAATLVIEVEDDAGGFDLATAPAGRGLDGLCDELGDGSLSCARTEQGSCLRVHIPLTTEEDAR
jgi:signal transduction histidine kinase